MCVTRKRVVSDNFDTLQVCCGLGMIADGKRRDIIALPLHSLNITPPTTCSYPTANAPGKAMEGAEDPTMGDIVASVMLFDRQTSVKHNSRGNARLAEAASENDFQKGAQKAVEAIAAPKLPKAKKGASVKISCDGSAVDKDRGVDGGDGGEGSVRPTKSKLACKISPEEAPNEKNATTLRRIEAFPTMKEPLVSSVDHGTALVAAVSRQRTPLGTAVPPDDDSNEKRASTCLCGAHATVTVEARTWTGINKHGGVGRLMKDNGDGTFNVKYLLGGSERRVDRCYIQCNAVAGADPGEAGKRAVKGPEFFVPQADIPVSSGAEAARGSARRPRNPRAEPEEQTEQGEKQAEKQEKERRGKEDARGEDWTTSGTKPAKARGRADGTGPSGQKRSLVQANQPQATSHPATKARGPMHKSESRKMAPPPPQGGGSGTCMTSKGDPSAVAERAASSSPPRDASVQADAPIHPQARQERGVQDVGEAVPSEHAALPPPAADTRFLDFKRKLSQAVIENVGGLDQISLEQLKGAVVGEGQGRFSGEEMDTFLQRLEADNHLMLVDQTVYIV